MKKHLLFSTLTSLLLLSSCGESSSAYFSLDDCPVIAETTPDNLTIIHLDQVKDTLTLPISALLSEYAIVEMDNSTDDALINATDRICVTDNYIGVGLSYSQKQYQLFDRQGTYIGAPVRKGQGPNELATSSYDSFIDDKTGNVYIAGFSSINKLLVNDMYGNPIRTIPLCLTAPKMKFDLDLENETLTAFALPFPNMPLAVWQQDLNGKMKQYVRSNSQLAVPFDFSNEVEHRGNTSNMDYSLIRFDKKPDSLYHYDTKANKLVPVLTATYPIKDDIPFHYFAELPDYYMMVLLSIVWSRSDANGAMVVSKPTPGPFTIIVDKKTLKGSFVKFSLDMLGGIEMPTADFSHGYFTRSFEPLDLQDQIAKVMAKHKEKLSSSVLKRLEHLNQIDENANNILLITKLRQPGDPDTVIDKSPDPKAPRKVYERKAPAASTPVDSTSTPATGKQTPPPPPAR